tara:strand:+ start:7667 stop:7819 length:153 start_codon:yes stop_codon:yes gene_type:complete
MEDLDNKIKKEIRKQQIKTQVILIGCLVGIYFLYSSIVKDIEAENFMSSN